MSEDMLGFDPRPIASSVFDLRNLTETFLPRLRRPLEPELDLVVEGGKREGEGL